MLTVLWLWEWSRTVDGGDARDTDLHLPIIPLFETIDYLRDSARIYVFYFEKDWRNAGNAYQSGDNDD